MQRYRLYWLPAFVLCLTTFILGTPLGASAAPDILFIIDSSGSMTKRMSNGKTQMETAIEAVTEAMKTIPPHILVGVRTFGHRIPRSNQKGSCKDTELVLPFQPVNANAARQVLKSIHPQGWTSIGNALREARTDLYDVGAGRSAERMIVLLSDGDETCDGNPVEVLEQFKKEGFLVQVNIVGFNVDPATRKQLESLSNVGNGAYFDAKNPEDLNKALKDAVNKDNVGGCGLGSKLLGGQRGMVPQVLAVTTNASSGTQTFGISSGTSGCTQNGTVKSNWKTALYVRDSLTHLAKDTAQGHGEYLATLSDLLGVSPENREHFNAYSQQHFSDIFPENASANEVLLHWQTALRADMKLQQYASGFAVPN